MFIATHQTSVSPRAREWDILPTSAALNSFAQHHILAGNIQSAWTWLLTGVFIRGETSFTCNLRGPWIPRVTSGHKAASHLTSVLAGQSRGIKALL